MSRGDPLRVRDYLEHIAQAIANIREYTAGMAAAAFLADRKTQDAVVRNFEVIGEAWLISLHSGKSVESGLQTIINSCRS